MPLGTCSHRALVYLVFCYSLKFSCNRVEFEQSVFHFTPFVSFIILHGVSEQKIGLVSLGRRRIKLSAT